MTYPNKPAETNLPINDLIKNRWSPRLFADKPIESEKITCLFESARWAPSSRNDQPWQYYYATKNNPEGFNKLFSLMKEPNQVWAKTADMLVLVFARKNFTYNNLPNYNCVYDTGTATGFLVLEAENQGLRAHQMIGIELDKTYEAVGLSKDEYEVMAMIALGYSATDEQLQTQDAEFIKRELELRTRKELNTIVVELK